jgi:excinuclease ABC subunit A
MNKKKIVVKGARLHNLKNIDVEIPHNKFTVVTGVSGSGKSSLAFNTIYAEGQRRFVESLSSYARQFLERMAKPDVDSISGLQPAIAIEQNKATRNPRSTVGTTTEVYDYLRLMFGRIGKTICKGCGEIIKKDSPDSAAEKILKYDEGDKLYILFAMPQHSRNVQEEIDRLKENGFFRIVMVDSNDIIDLEGFEIPKRLRPDEFYGLADRIVVRDNHDTLSRLHESLESAFHNGEGRIAIRNISKNSTERFSRLYECSKCDVLYAEPEPRLFSFNNPFGACPHCQGFGRTIGIDEDLVIPEKNKTIEKGAVHPFRTQGFAKYQRSLLTLCREFKIPINIPYENLSPEHKDRLWKGKSKFTGIDGFYTMLEDKNYKLHYRVILSRYRGYTRCKHCEGTRLRTSGRQVYIDGKNIPELIHVPLGVLNEYLMNMNLSEQDQSIVVEVMREIRWRVNLLVEIGLEYLTLSRLTHTLSGGESQRINLSTALGSALVGTLYVLDEPSIGLHPRDTDRLLGILYKLRNLGNTIVVVEHDPDIIEAADYIIDIGPGAGENGGELIHAGSMAKLLKNKKSLTAQYLTGIKKMEAKPEPSKGNGKSIVIHKPRRHNLKMDLAEFPLNKLIVVTGVSGSGKSTLVHDILYKGLKKIHTGFDGKATATFDLFEGGHRIEQVDIVDQSSIGKSSRSTPVTYTKAFDAIREVFTSTQAAKQLGLKPGFFSFNVSGGRCEECEGEGFISVDMQFLPDVQLTCEACNGTRYKREAREILFKGKSIVDVLNMTIDEALEFFADIKKVTRKLQTMHDVGLGYLRLGQPSTMLSGGESQRIKLSQFLEVKSNNSMYIFDEPTTGLHLDDISKLLKCFRRLVENGNSVVIIEHNLNIIAAADHIIDIGPEAGDRGGDIVCQGTSEEILNSEYSLTGKALAHFLLARKED